MSLKTYGQPLKRLGWDDIRKSLDTYEHKALKSSDSTRLLLLWPEVDGEDIQGQLMEVPFDELDKLPGGIEFSSLSYHWGGDEGDKELIYLYDQDMAAVATAAIARAKIEKANAAQVNVAKTTRSEGLKRRTYHVKINLYHALMALRKQEHPVLLWVDALCIDQNNPTEKTVQLAKIDYAYRLAPSVIIWLGPEDEGGRRKRAIEFVKYITDENTGRNIETIVSNSKHIEDWISLVELTQLSWFSRKWIIQELALAKHAEVRCGSLDVPWHNLQVAIYLMERYSEQIRRLTKNSVEHEYNYHAFGDVDTLEAKALADTVHNMFQRTKDGGPGEPNLGLEYLVSALACFYSSDPRDTINAFRNISIETRGSSAMDDEKSPPKATYALDKTLAEIYVDFFRWIYETSHSIDIICRKWALPEKLKRPKRPKRVKDLTKKKEYIYPELSDIPSYIQTVVVPTEQLQAASMPARTEGVSLVGLPSPGKAPYNASNSMPAGVVFLGKPQAAQKPEVEALAENETKAWAGTDLVNNAQEESSARQSSAERTQDDREMPTDQELGESFPPAVPKLLMVDGIDLSNVVRADGAKLLRETKSSTSLTGSKSKKRLPPQSIRVAGVQVGTIKWHTSSMQQGVIHKDVMIKLAPGVVRKRAKGQDLAPADIPDKLWRGLVAERGADGNNPPPTYPSACRYIMQKFLAKDGSLNIRDLVPKKDVVDFEKDYLYRVYAVSYNRSWFEASPSLKVDQDDGLFLHGFGPADVKDGDIICILFGCSVPVILHRDETQKNEEYYTLVGECYVYGLMDGEAIRSMKRIHADTGKDLSRDFILF